MQSNLSSIFCILLVVSSSVICEQEVRRKIFDAVKRTIKDTGKKVVKVAKDPHAQHAAREVMHKFIEHHHPDPTAESKHTHVVKTLSNGTNLVTVDAEAAKLDLISNLTSASAVSSVAAGAGGMADSMLLGVGLNGTSMAVSSRANVVANDDEAFLSTTGNALGNAGKHVTDTAARLFGDLSGAVNASSISVGNLNSAGVNAASGIIQIAAELEAAGLGLLGDITKTGTSLLSGATKGVGIVADSVLTEVGYEGAGKAVSNGADVAADVTDLLGSAAKSAFNYVGKKGTATAAKIGGCITGANSSSNDTDQLAFAGADRVSCLLKTAAELKATTLGVIGNLTSDSAYFLSGATKGVGLVAESVLTDVGLEDAGEMVRKGTNVVADVTDRVGSSTKVALDGAGKYLAVAAGVIGDGLTGTNTSAVARVVDQVGSSTKVALDGAAKYLADAAGESMGNSANFVVDVTEQVGSATKDALDGAGKVANDIADQVGSATKDALDGAGKVANDIADQISSAFSIFG